MQAYELPELRSEAARGGRPYFEFLRVQDLSAGLYRLPAGGLDAQLPHAQDEIYCVVDGTAHVRVGDEDRPVQPGSVIYVPKGVVHKFHSIGEDLVLLVFFAPAESPSASVS